MQYFFEWTYIIKEILTFSSEKISNWDIECDMESFPFYYKWINPSYICRINKTNENHITMEINSIKEIE